MRLTGSSANKWAEAEQHLDRVESILRGLRVPASDLAFPSSAASRQNDQTRQKQPRPRRYQQRKHQQQQDWQQQQQKDLRQLQHQDWRQQQQRHCGQHEGCQLCASQSSLSPQFQSQSRSRTMSQSSGQTNPHQLQGKEWSAADMSKTPPPKREQEEEAGRAFLQNQTLVPADRQRFVGGVNDNINDDDDGEDSRAAAAAAAAVTAAPPANRSGVAGGSVETSLRRGGGGGDGSLLPPNPTPKSIPSLRERAARTWWRGLSCGVCFAAGAWAREGHGAFAASLALAAVCGETLLSPR